MASTTLSVLSGFDFSTVISFFALVTAVFALGWNIIRDLIMDRVKIDIRVSFGDVRMINGTTTKAIFEDARSDFSPAAPKVCFRITNVGRRPMVISKIHGLYWRPMQGNSEWLFISKVLPRKVEPYESIDDVSDGADLLEGIRSKNIRKILIEDSKGKKWRLTSKAIKRLELTAAYVK